MSQSCSRISLASFSLLVSFLFSASVTRFDVPPNMGGRCVHILVFGSHLGRNDVCDYLGALPSSLRSSWLRNRNRLKVSLRTLQKHMIGHRKKIRKEIQYVQDWPTEMGNNTLQGSSQGGQQEREGGMRDGGREEEGGRRGEEEDEEAVGHEEQEEVTKKG